MSFSENTADWKSMAISSETRNWDAKASNTAVFFVNDVTEMNILLPNLDIKLMAALGSHVLLYFGLGGFKL